MVAADVQRAEEWRSTLADVLLSFATPLIIVLVNVTTMFTDKTQRIVNSVILFLITCLLLYQSCNGSFKTVDSNEKLANIILDDFRRLQCRLIQVYVKAALSINTQHMLMDEQLQVVDYLSPHEASRLINRQM